VEHKGSSDEPWSGFFRFDRYEIITATTAMIAAKIEHYINTNPCLLSLGYVT
jgi:hypothetical protein